MNKVLKHLNLKGFETKVFPAKLCTLPSSPGEEPGVLESKKLFVCLVADSRRDDGLRIMLLRPYLWTGDTGVFSSRKSGTRKVKTFYGWVDRRNNPVDHKTRRIHNDYDHVVAWKPV